MRSYKYFFSLLLAIALGAFPSQAFAQSRFNPEISPLEQSRAYQLFQTRQKNELSKLVFLIDRFKDSKIKIVYDGIEYSPPFVAKLARWFLPSHYHDENAEKWIMVWCNKSYSERKLIWVKDSKENVKLAREVLLEELKALESQMVKSPNVSRTEESKQTSKEAVAPSNPSKQG